MKKLLKQLVDQNGMEILLDVSKLQKKLEVSEKNKLQKQQLLLLLSGFSKNDLELLKENDSLKKSNVIRRCMNSTGMSADSSFDLFSDILYALGCSEYLNKSEWFCGGYVDAASEKAVMITSKKSVHKALNLARETGDQTEAMSIYRALADAGVPQAETKVALEYLKSENLAVERKKVAYEYLNDAASKGYEPACQHLGDACMAAADFDEASKWYGHAVGIGFKEESISKIKFLNYLRRQNFKAVLISVLAAIMSIIVVIYTITISAPGIGSAIGAWIFEGLSLFISLFIILMNLSLPYKNITPCIIVQAVLWVLAMTILI